MCHLSVFRRPPGWAKISVTLGVGAGPVPRRRLSEDRLAAAIAEAVSSSRLRENARHLAARLREEDGVKNAIEIIARA
jgi:sterol 3beta-glucosyltransferase